MAVLKCKMCGGTLDVQEGMTVCGCEYCGSKQTIPTADNEKKIKLFERANRLRINCEFDKAGSVYESIIEEFPEEAEGYWGNLLCKYGIEYVDDPATGDKVPTCHRSSFESIMDDEDFDLVMEYADMTARSVYREQAKQIEEIRKGIVEVSAHEQPYDIFICYKETDENGDRTLDSVLAQDVYDALTDKRYRVFFSRISLEDKLGTEYEPYIFAALNSAKIMLVFGTSYDYYNAVWVKNEWSRYLRLMAKDKTKHLIPCYKDIDAYDIPKEFAKLQAQDMGKVGAVQDLIRGIDKLMGRDVALQVKETSNQTIIQQVSGGPNTSSLIDRGNMSLEDGAVEEAIGYFNRALDIDSKSAEAYLGLFMADINARERNAARDAFVIGDYTSDRNWTRARQFATGTLLKELNDWEIKRNIHVQEIDKDKEKIGLEFERLQAQLDFEDFELTSEETEELAGLENIAREMNEACKHAEEVYETCQEKQNVSRLERDIHSKEVQMKSLGIFKGREKKELQTQIDALTVSLREARSMLGEKLDKLKKMQNDSSKAQKTADEYKRVKIEEKKKVLKERIAELNVKIVELNMIDVVESNLRKATTGDTVLFGRYEQGDGVAPIEWRVLDKKGSQILLISKYCLDCKKYRRNQEDNAWIKSDLRQWLNSEFLSSAFTAEENRIIAETKCDNIIKAKASTYKGEDTIDKIFALSMTEADTYFSSKQDRQCKPTAYAIAQQGYTKETTGYSLWWLRSPGTSTCFAADVDTNGDIDFFGSYLDNKSYNVCVRPALWIIVGA